MLQFVFDLVVSWLPIWDNYLIYLLALVAIMFVPAFVYSMFRS